MAFGLRMLADGFSVSYLFGLFLVHQGLYVILQAQASVFSSRGTTKSAYTASYL
jgi:hypothetical protein